MNSLISNPGLAHITNKILWSLDHQSQLNCRKVSCSFKAQVHQPYFWIKKCDQKGQSQDLRDAWMELLVDVEKGSELEYEFSNCLMEWHEKYNKQKHMSTPIQIAGRNGYFELFKFIASKVENPNEPQSNGWTYTNAYCSTVWIY